VVGVVRLHARDGSADVRLRGGLVRRVRKLRYEGIAIASRIPRMMMTTRSSMSVKAALICPQSLPQIGHYVSFGSNTAVAPAYIGLRCLAAVPPNG
jgi:hypothetical protein